MASGPAIVKEAVIWMSEVAKRLLRPECRPGFAAWPLAERFAIAR